MSRFAERLARAEARVNRAFATELPVTLVIGDERRDVVAIFECPDRPVDIPGGGDIQDRNPAISALTADITGLEKHCAVFIGDEPYRVTHVGTDEEGRTRITLAYGAPGNPVPVIDRWSK